MKLPDSPDLDLINYELPDHKIAKRPLAKRSDAKLLAYRQGNISDNSFEEIEDFLDRKTTLCFNNTKVIPARLYFHKETGAQIEIFLLNPITPSTIMSSVMEETKRVSWQCMIGNFKRWKEDQTLISKLSCNGDTIHLKATIIDRDEKHIAFEWDNSDYSFAEIVELAGEVPLPPYLNRAPEAEDKPRYQTVYSEEEGAVAAPTAGLHFTADILKNLKDKGITESFLTLHVSAGTFQPIKVSDAREHPMHSEQVEITKETVDQIIAAEQVVAVGTTSMRSLESLYWFGVRLINGNDAFAIDKLEIYQEASSLPSRKLAFETIAEWMDRQNLVRIHGTTEIFIMPGYKFKVCDGLITNFHQPGSTLLLLIAAFIGEDWQKVYDHALKNNYRFLSYGDSSILLP
ncbi:S-adenosylmethionine:tRNA ribosyltransferase-isomerase [Roseivirga misakiensis]|uniref:S-adenosylmethionine:tRNA ribosyltransferase-isomerase n=1 Tax=Roseivirga misakiensis TaxID=1563681 RepID=A0A1E5T1F4_9BACT|nr:S-adenosylmethionine:tRNA ribosyltransferase-isomerase [Roseivirga misakiensis]OEK05137.1 S-adenosylmethionine tRNA ribosyltransferase [Roseivirga misakiensis]